MVRSGYTLRQEGQVSGSITPGKDGFKPAGHSYPAYMLYRSAIMAVTAATCFGFATAGFYQLRDNQSSEVLRR